MSSVKSSSSAGDSAWKELERHDGRGGEIVKMGYLKKLKTMKKKFFVLRGESTEASARLEYYDTEKKWRSHHSPKRTIALKTCFNINRRNDTKHKYVIALYTKDDCFCLVLETEEELDEWLKSLLSLQQGEDVPDGEPPKPTFEHVWQVTLQKKGLGNSKHILGPYLLCLTDKTLSLVSKNQEEKPDTYEFSLMCIRRCGHSDCFFYMEVGRSACTGAGDLWMQTEDPNIAQNMHAAILSAMTSNNSNLKEELGPRPRNRSSSANEASKPITMIPRKISHLGTMKASCYSTSEDVMRGGGHLNFRAQPSATYAEQSCVSPSTPDAIHSQVCIGSLPGSNHCHHIHHRVAPIHHPPVPTSAVRPSQRRHSVSAMCVSSVGGAGSGSAANNINNNTTSNNNNNNNNINNAPLGAPTHQRTYSFPLSEPSSGVAPAPAPPSWDGRRASTGRSAGKRSGGSGSSRSSTAAGRERCDSLPSRARTTSEGHHQPPPHALPTPTPRGAHLVPGHGMVRPHSMYTRGVSHSPPVGSSPVSPASGACSTDSAGSSLSIDDAGDGWNEEGMVSLGRYSTSLTPDEPAIMEVEEYAQWPGPGSGGTSDGNYLPMDRNQPSLSLPIQSATSVTTVTAPHRKISPNLSSSGFKSGSPSQGSYMEMYSPCGSSPMENTGYMAMSPGGGGSAPLEATPRMQIYSRAASSANHSRGSSLAEDGYVPMGPGLTDDGYVDMDPLNPSHSHEHFHHSEMSPASSCSITSGTPSTDLRFSEYHLEKVSSYFTPSEEDETSSLDRPIPRAYSVGSRPDNMKKPLRLEGQTHAMDPASRVRAFSVGSRCPLGGSGSSSLRHGPHSSHSSVEPMDDLMEMDFTRTPKSSGKTSTAKSVSRNKGDSTLPPHHSSTGPPSGYMDMSQRNVGVSKPHTPTSGPYLEMKPGHPDSIAASPPGSNVISRSPKSSVHAGPYMEMKPGLPQDSTLSSSGDSRVQSVPISVPSKPAGMSVSPKTHGKPFTEIRVGSGISEVARKASMARSPPTRPTVVTSSMSVTSMSFTSEELPYVPMKPGVVSSDSSLSYVYTTKPIPVPTTATAGPYMDMKPGTGGDCQLQNLPPTTPHRTVATPTNVSPKSSFSVGPYVDMGQPAFSASSSFSRQASRKPASPIQEEYVDMSLKPVRKTSRQETGVTVVGSTVINRTAPVDTPQPKKPPEGYVEMSWNRGSKTSPKSSLEDYKSPPSSSQDDYMNLSFDSRGSFSKRKERRNSRKEKARYSSQPITIGGPPKDGGAKTSSASTSPVFSFMGRKSSTGTPPKIPPAYLPLSGGTAAGGCGGVSSPSGSPFSSLRRTRKISSGSRRESGDTNSGLTTPTGSTTIFPLSLNSPGSPMKPFPGTTTASSTSSKPILHSVPGSEAQPCHKCPVDATSGSVRISYSYPEMQLSTSSTGSTPVTPDSSSSSEQPTPVNTESVDDMTKVEDSRSTDYVNYCPRKGIPTAGSTRDDCLSEYAIMRPVPVVRAGTHEATRKISAPTFGVMNRRFNNIHQGVANLTLSSPTLNSSKTVIAPQEVTPPVTRKGIFTNPLPSAAPLCKPNSKSSVGILNAETSNGPKVITSEGSSSLSRQPSNASNSSKASCSSRESKGSRQLSRSSSGSSEVGRTLESSRSVEDKSDTLSVSESLSVKSEDSGTISPASSQTAVASRPPSVISERELHYASLDLAPSGSEGEDCARSPRTLKTQGSLTESSNSSPSPNPVHSGSVGGTGSEAFTYAEIDFSRQDASRGSSSSLSSSKKVKQ